MTSNAYARGMSGRARKVSNGPRFDERRIAARIDAARIAAGLEVKEFCARVGWGKSDYTKKVVKVQTAMSVWDFERVAEVLDGPPGWPFIDERLGRMLKDWLDLAAAQTPKR